MDENQFYQMLCYEDLDAIKKVEHLLIPSFLNRSFKGRTFLIVALECAEIDKIDYLISIGADVNVTDSSNNPPLSIAIDMDLQFESEEYILDYPDYFYQNKRKTAPVGMQLTQLILEYHPNLDVKDNEGESVWDRVIPGFPLHTLLLHEAQWQKDNNYYQ